MANLLELAEKMGIKSDSLQEKKVSNNVTKRRPWLEDEGEQSIAGINLSQINIPKLEEPVKRKHVVRLDELSDSYSNPDKKKESFNNEPVKKGELIKPISNTEKVDRQLEKVEIKTSRLLTKHFDKEELKAQKIVKPSLKHNQTIAKASVNHSPKKCKVSYVDYLMMKGIRKEILKYVKDNMFEDDGDTYSFIDTEEIISKIDTSANVIRDTIYKLKKEGWFMIENQQYSRRLVKINPNNYQKE